MGYTSAAFLVVVCFVVAEGAVLPDRNSLELSPVSGSDTSFPAHDAIHPYWLHLTGSDRIRSRREANRKRGNREENKKQKEQSEKSDNVSILHTLHIY